MYIHVYACIYMYLFVYTSTRIFLPFGERQMPLTPHSALGMMCVPLRAFRCLSYAAFMHAAVGVHTEAVTEPSR